MGLCGSARASIRLARVAAEPCGKDALKGQGGRTRSRAAAGKDKLSGGISGGGGKDSEVQ